MPIGKYRFVTQRDFAKLEGVTEQTIHDRWKRGIVVKRVYKDRVLVDVFDSRHNANRRVQKLGVKPC